MSGTTINYKALTEAEVLRRHILYQTSYIGSTWTPVPIRSKSPLKREAVHKPKIFKREVSVSPVPKRKTPGMTSRDSSPGKKKAHVTKSASGVLDDRRHIRADRRRPWKEKVPKASKKNSISVLFYDKVLPPDVNKMDVIMRPRRYVSNTKYGDIYELRQDSPRKQEKTPPTRKWLWEDEFLLWQKGSRKQYLEEVGTKTKTNSTPSAVNSYTSRGDNLPSIKEHPNRPSAELYASYHFQRLERTSRRMAAVLLQKAYRGWHVRHSLKILKRKALLEHGRPWLKFIADYRELVARIRSRYCITKSSCPVDLKQIADFMDKKLKYEKVFGQFAPIGKLHREDLMEFFNRCDLWPTQRDINRCFDTVFRGSRNTAEVIFLLDCSSSIGLIGFHKLTKLVKDIVLSLDIAPDRTRVGVVPYNEGVFGSFGLTTFSDKNDILAAISLVKLRQGLTRTDIALRQTRDLFKDSRAGVQKIAIIITDGKSTYPNKTATEGKLLREVGVQVFAIGVGNKADHEELGQLATTADHCYKALDVKSLSHIRRQIEKRLCFDDDVMRATGMKACLRLVVQAKLEREGFVMVPSTLREGVERATTETQVMQALEKYIFSQKGSVR